MASSFRSTFLLLPNPILLPSSLLPQNTPARTLSTMTSIPPTDPPTISKSALKKAKKLAAAVLPASLTGEAPSTPPPAPPSTFSLTATAPVFTPASASKPAAAAAPEREYPVGGAGSGVVGKRIKVLQKKVVSTRSGKGKEEKGRGSKSKP